MIEGYSILAKFALKDCDEGTFLYVYAWVMQAVKECQDLIPEKSSVVHAGTSLVHDMAITPLPPQMPVKTMMQRAQANQQKIQG